MKGEKLVNTVWACFGTERTPTSHPPPFLLYKMILGVLLRGFLLGKTMPSSWATWVVCWAFALMSQTLLHTHLAKGEFSTQMPLVKRMVINSFFKDPISCPSCPNRWPPLLHSLAFHNPPLFAVDTCSATGPGIRQARGATQPLPGGCQPALWGHQIHGEDRVSAVHKWQSETT